MKTVTSGVISVSECNKNLRVVKILQYLQCAICLYALSTRQIGRSGTQRYWLRSEVPIKGLHFGTKILQYMEERNWAQRILRLGSNGHVGITVGVEGVENKKSLFQPGIEPQSYSTQIITLLIQISRPVLTYPHQSFYGEIKTDVSRDSYSEAPNFESRPSSGLTWGPSRSLQSNQGILP
jgi:hypothetical protein